ncbi:STAS domain-containing protein [Nocardioides alkalitolerans]|uniref:STAS domain-containing protein n=1 Tax=Nocardioides alkalitolerans TaxID=281714 RepID=UPI00041F60F9|nr:STAS domain-containing protein [Nocardioides alkalitolerans]
MEEQPFGAAVDAESRTLTVTGGIYGWRDVQAFEAALTEASDGLKRDLRVDLSHAEFFPSLGIGTLIAVRRRAKVHGADITLVAAEGSLAHRALTITGLPVDLV